MAAEKRYWWLKLQKDFFKSKRIKKLRKLAGGDTYTIIYLKMQLLSLQTDGMLYYSELEDTFAEEIALDIDEEPENVAITIQYMLRVGLMETKDNLFYTLPFVTENIGCETQEAVRQRKSRKNRKLLQSCDNSVTLSQNCHVEKEKELEIEKDKEYIGSKAPKFSPPSIDEVAAYCKERNNNINPEAFIDYYASQKWKKANGRPLEDWKAAVRTWEKKDFNNPPKKQTFNNCEQRATDYDSLAAAIVGGNT